MPNQLDSGKNSACLLPVVGVTGVRFAKLKKCINWGALMQQKTITIAGRKVGPGHPALIIAEVAQNHDGSLGTAHAYIDAVADMGADAVKFQTHIADAESTLDEPFRVKFSRQDDTRYAYWKRMEFTPEAWQGLAKHAAERGLIFLSSPFSVQAVELLSALGTAAWKVGSGEIASPDLLEAMLTKRKPILLSTGMSTYAEIENFHNAVVSKGHELALFQCTSKYPVDLESVGLNCIETLRERFQCPVGLSDHSGTPFPALAALARGADLLEVHVTLSKRCFGPDVSASLTLEELSTLCNARDAFHVMLTNPVDKDNMAAELGSMRDIFRKSVCLSTSKPAGTILTREMLILKKPGNGIPAKDIDKVLGKRLLRDCTSDRLLRWEDIDA
ncbi:MAG: N-acetylneuraminate synthase family protein [Desulfovibrio sp.]|jgi:N-acetylneuraminate synthase